MYVAIPAASAGVIHGAVRITYPTTELDRRVRQYWLRLAALSGAVLATVGVVGFLLARGVTRPVRDLEQVAVQLSSGDLTPGLRRRAARRSCAAWAEPSTPWPTACSNSWQHNDRSSPTPRTSYGPR